MDLIAKIIQSIEDPLLLSLILIVVTLVWIFKTPIVEHIKKSKIKKSPPKKKKIISLKTHDVFPTMNRVRNEVANMKFYTDKKFDRVKTLMCFDFTNHKVIQCSKRMGNIIKIPNIDTMSRNALKKLIFDEQNLMHQGYIDAIKKEWRSRGIEEDDIDYVIHLFEKFRYDVVASFENRINAIFSNDNYNTNFGLMLAIFEMWAMGIDLLPRDMSTTFESLNGKFKNLKYRK
tara:strand:+ start:1063 stop:1755 length:693 start_codon:yes stop_codon:yes gene_type:complete